MNVKRRKELKEILEMLEVAKYRLEEVKDEEEESFDNIPENLQGSVSYEIAEEIIECLDYAYETFDDIINNIENVIG